MLNKLEYEEILMRCITSATDWLIDWALIQLITYLDQIPV